MLRICIVEDATEDYERLSSLLEAYEERTGRQLSVVRLGCTEELLAIGIANEDASVAAPDGGLVLPYDVVFMDIELPGLDGMRLATQLRERGCNVPLIFVTNLAQHAADGYSVDAVDYIIKPATLANLTLALDRVLTRVRQADTSLVMIPMRTGFYSARVQDLVYVSVNNHSLAYYLDGRAEPIVTTGTLKAAEKSLAEKPFVRASSHAIVNLSHVSSARREELLMSNGDHVPVSRAQRASVLAALARFLGTPAATAIAAATPATSATTPEADA